MVERYVFVKLKDEYAAPEARQQVIDKTLADLRDVPGVVKLIVGRPADSACEGAWDLSIVVVFDQLADVKPYLEHPAHRRYVDEYLVPRMKVIKYWNFDVAVVEP